MQVTDQETLLKGIIPCWYCGTPIPSNLACCWKCGKSQDEEPVILGGWAKTTSEGKHHFFCEEAIGDGMLSLCHMTVYHGDPEDLLLKIPQDTCKRCLTKFKDEFSDLLMRDTGMYWCTECDHRHEYSSQIGQEHLEHKR